MKFQGRARTEGILLLFLAGLLFVFPEQSAQAAQQGLTLSVQLLIPSLFPFFVLSSLCIATGLADALARWLAPLMFRLFGVSGSGASALILGAIGGYPTGARTLAQLVQNGTCSPEEAQRLSLFCNNCGPAFFIGAAGAGIFKSKEAGFLLLGTHLAAALILGLVLCRTKNHQAAGSVPPSVPAQSLAAALPDCVRSAFTSVLSVCSYVILFSVLTALVQCSGLLPLCIKTLARWFAWGDTASQLLQSFLTGCLELSAGTAALKPLASSPAALPMAAFILGWGGLSVHCQSLPFWQSAGISLPSYLKAKWMQGLIAAGLTALAAALMPLPIPTMATLPAAPVSHLLRQELVALWGCSGLYFFLFPPKRLPSTRRHAYNKQK